MRTCVRECLCACVRAYVRACVRSCARARALACVCAMFFHAMFHSHLRAAYVGEGPLKLFHADDLEQVPVIKQNHRGSCTSALFSSLLNCI